MSVTHEQTAVATSAALRSDDPPGLGRARRQRAPSDPWVVPAPVVRRPGAQSAGDGGSSRCRVTVDHPRGRRYTCVPAEPRR
jgi:hypothetical protein